MSNRRKLAKVRKLERRCPKCKTPNPTDRGTFWHCNNPECTFPWPKKGRRTA